MESENVCKHDFGTYKEDDSGSYQPVYQLKKVIFTGVFQW